MNLVSVIIPTYRRGDYLERAIVSVLNQTYKNIEIIVVDDNGDNEYRKETEAKLEKHIHHHNFKYVKNTSNMGGSASRNNGASQSNGEYLCFLDDDDFFEVDKIEEQIKRLKSLDSSWGGVYCNYKKYSNQRQLSRTTQVEEGNLLYSMLSMENPLATGSTLMIKRSVFLELGGFDTRFKRHQDWEFMIRFFRKYKLALVEAPLVCIDSSSNINRIDPDVIRKSKDMLFQEFSEDISTLTLEEVSKIKSAHQVQLAKIYLGSGEYKRFFNIVFNIEKLSFLNLSKLTVLFLMKVFLNKNRSGY